MERGDRKKGPFKLDQVKSPQNGSALRSYEILAWERRKRIGVEIIERETERVVIILPSFLSE